MHAERAIRPGCGRDDFVGHFDVGTGPPAGGTLMISSARLCTTLQPLADIGHPTPTSAFGIKPCHCRALADGQLAIDDLGADLEPATSGLGSGHA
jgi:hypothetical protein